MWGACRRSDERRDTVSLPEIRLDDLVRREPLAPEVAVNDAAALAARVANATVLVTGAGGSIGAELCRQLAAAKPARLVLVGRGENSIFEIDQELGEDFPDVARSAVILDIRDKCGMRDVLADTQPRAVFHAAAHKHVPLMEQNAREALRNNMLGTQSVVAAAEAAGVRHLVLISTDKAVRPTSVMGASKRLSELVVQEAAQRTGHAYVSVRFGNVLGSRGSVVPTFLRQIAHGGPVLVTHPEMRRYFMTNPEAVQLVLQAFVLGQGGETFCLDMGEALSITALAQELIRRAGFVPDVDIAIRYTGVRPGEKLHEEPFFGPGLTSPTAHPRVLRAHTAPIGATAADELRALEAMLAGDATVADMRALIARLIPDLEMAETGAAR